MKSGILDKKTLYEDAKQYIQELIISRRMTEVRRWAKAVCTGAMEVLMPFKPLMAEMNLVRHYQWIYDNVDNASRHMMEDYLCWHAAKYINRKGTGRNVPTNALTANLKANPLLYVLLFRTERADMKKMIQKK